ncbi:MAG: tRNA 2-thiocytidine biosynthesis TtcA family protein [Spirochaetaceae bacterium]|jgi:tRNA 2-thiocytidine biosynthesis protein TtcA|nr:tRNA 2-thiocytidine biosynthesis TtcA family protein [Spirochaetaceae bacterium]
MSNRFLRRAGAGEVVRKLVTKAVLERGLIAEGDRLLIAVSGGKDSTVLAWALSAIKPAVKKHYEIRGIHISSDFCSCCKKAALAARLADWGIPFEDLFVPVIGRLKEGQRMNCYWCSTQRRTELLKYAVEHHFNKIALGHHLDDIIETFFMNMTAKGALAAMPMLLNYRKYPVSLIRPLGYVEEQQVIACAGEKGLLSAVCTCPYGLHSKRRDVRKRIAEFTGNSGAVKRRILRALSSGDLLTSPPPD